MSLLARLVRRATIELDLARLRLHRRLLAPIAPVDAPVALFVSVNEYIYSLKLEGMVAKAVELAGYRPVFVVSDGAVLAPRYLRAFGIRRTVDVARYADASLAETAVREAERLLAGRPTAHDLAELEYRGAAIGRYVLSTLSRALHEGTVDLDDERARGRLREILTVAIRSTLAAEAMLDDLQPHVVVFIERGYAAEAPFSDLALGRGLNVVQFVAGLQDDSFVFKRFTQATRRLHPRSVSDESWAEVLALPWTPERDAAVHEEFRRRYDGSQRLVGRNQEWTEPMTADEARARLGLTPGKRTAVVFSHVLWDANMFYGEDLFDDQEQWFVETVRAAAANDRVDWVVKLHPANVWKRRRDGVEHEELDDLRALREALGELPPHVKLLLPDSPVPTRALFDLTDWGVTIRGSVGFELPCLGIPVVTAGTGFYSGRGFTVDSATHEEYLARLAAIEQIPPLTPEQVELARRHAYALFRMRPTRFTSFRTDLRPLRDAGHLLEQDLRLLLRSRRELLEAPDLNRLAEWIGDRERLDYLQES